MTHILVRKVVIYRSHNTTDEMVIPVTTEKPGFPVPVE